MPATNSDLQFTLQAVSLLRKRIGCFACIRQPSHSLDRKRWSSSAIQRAILARNVEGAAPKTPDSLNVTVRRKIDSNRLVPSLRDFGGRTGIVSFLNVES